MKNKKLFFYGFKWFAFVLLSVLTAKESNSRIMLFILIVYVAVILIWEGIKDFYVNTKSPEKDRYPDS
jgi:phosphatidylglycerophosphate synthase